MKNVTTAAIFFLAAGIFTSVSILAAYQILFVIPLIYYTVLTIKEKKFELPKSSWFLLAFTLVGFISLILNFEVIPKPSANFGKLKYFIYATFGIFVLRSWNLEVSDKTKRFLSGTFFVSIIVAGIYAMWEYFFSGAARVSSLTETMRYGYGSGMILLVILSAILHHKKMDKWLDVRLAIAAFIIGFIGMYLTYTRGALLGFLCGLPFVLYFFRPKLGIIMGGLAVLGVLTLTGFYLFGSGKYESRFLTNKNNNSDVIRRSQWKSALFAFEEKPILGWGYGNFHSQLKRIKYQYNLDAKAYDDAHSHNLFLEVASGTGIIGLFLFLGWLISWALEAFKGSQLTKALIIPLGVAFVVSSQFEVTLSANTASMLFFLYSMTFVSKNNVKQS